MPGCQWSPDHENVAAPLHVVIALMSTGPVGISDMIGGTNISLIQRTISADGSLLKPAKPLSSIDTALAAGSGTSEAILDNHVFDDDNSSSSNAENGSGSDTTPAAAAGDDAPKGFVYSTYTAALAAPCPADSKITDCSVPGTPGSANWTVTPVSSWIFVSFKMTAPYTLATQDFFPLVGGTSNATTIWPNAGPRQHTSHSFLARTFGDGAGCKDATPASACGN